VIYRVASRRFHGAVVGLLPEGFVAIIGSAVFGLGALALLFQGLGQLPAGSSAGVGQYLSGAVVALVVTAVFLRSLLLVLARRASRPGLTAGAG
jgi:hypothetical protein